MSDTFRDMDPGEILAKDRVLFLMERGAALQAQGAHEASARDFIRAAEELNRNEAYSVSKGGTSMVVNDNIQDYRGTPFERTLLHSVNAVNHLVLGHWNNASVEGRRILLSFDADIKDAYPDEAFSRYVAGLVFELEGDPSNAALQYRKAAELAGGLHIDERTGRVSNADATNAVDGDAGRELVCFVFTGRSPTGHDLMQSRPYDRPGGQADFYHDGVHLGRSFALADTWDLAVRTEEILATRKALKAGARVVTKEIIAESVAEHYDNDALGELIRLILIGLLERPDTRRWETLPRWLQIARFPCPADPGDIEVLIRDGRGTQRQRMRIGKPIARHGKTYLAFFRDSNRGPPAAGSGTP